MLDALPLFRSNGSTSGLVITLPELGILLLVVDSDQTVPLHDLTQPV